MSTTKIITIIILLLLVGVIIGLCFRIEWTDKDTEPQANVSLEYNNIVTEEEVGVDTEEEEEPDETVDWETYENFEAGFSLKYPDYVTLGELNNSADLVLMVGATKIDDLDFPSGYNKSTALKDRPQLEKGEYGEIIDWSGSRKVIKIDNTYAKDFIVLARFEVCNVTFERKALFYNNDYQIVITLMGNRDRTISSMPIYFRDGESEGCIGSKIWKQNVSPPFCEVLENHQGSGVAQEWYDTFDKIVDTITIY